MRPSMRLSSTNLLSILAVVVALLACAAYLMFGEAELPSVEMSRHGWIALGLGIAVSVLVGGVLAAVLIISRRRGFDEAAHQIYQDVDPRD